MRVKYSLVFAIVFTAAVVAVQVVLGDEVNARYNISQNSNTETIKIGNTKTKNYNVQESNYLPTQLTQVVLNVPKLNKKLRKSRQPTVEEFAIKRRIVDVYEEAKLGSHVHMNHLGHIIQALNPKYIATERVRRVAFADPSDPIRVEAPYLGLDGPLELRLESGSIGEQLDLLNERFRDQVRWSQSFIEELANTSDEVLNSEQAAFKRLLLCLSHPALCNLLANKEHSNFSEFKQEPDVIDSSASATNEVYAEMPEQNFNSLVANSVGNGGGSGSGEYPTNERNYRADKTNEPAVEYEPTEFVQRAPQMAAYEPQTAVQQPSQEAYEHRYGQQTPQQDYESQRIAQPTLPVRNFITPPAYKMPSQDQVVPMYNHGNTVRVVHHKNRFLPRLRNLRFSDQQSGPRILNPLAKQPSRPYQRF